MDSTVFRSSSSPNLGLGLELAAERADLAHVGILLLLDCDWGCGAAPREDLLSVLGDQLGLVEDRVVLGRPVHGVASCLLGR